MKTFVDICCSRISVFNAQCTVIEVSFFPKHFAANDRGTSGGVGHVPG